MTGKPTGQTSPSVSHAPEVETASAAARPPVVDAGTTPGDAAADQEVQPQPAIAVDVDHDPDRAPDDAHAPGGSATTLPDHEFDEDLLLERDRLDDRVSVGLPKLNPAPPPGITPLKLVTTGPPSVAPNATTKIPPSAAPAPGSDSVSKSSAREGGIKNADARTPTTETSTDLAELQWRSRLAARQRPHLDAALSDLPLITAQAWEAVHAANAPPFVYRFGGRIHWIESGEAGQLRLRRVRRVELRHVASRVAFWTVKEGKKLVTAVPPAAVMDDMLVAPDSQLPVLDRIEGTPAFASDGRLIATPGYDAESEILYAPPRGFVLPRLPSHPSGADVQAALAVIENIIQDFAFVDQSDRAHIVSMFLLPLVRELIPGPTPLHLIKKPAPGTGAGLLVDALMSTVLGRQLAVMTEGRGEEEMRKRITAKLRTAPAGVLFDNLKARLDSAALAAVLTAIVFEDRLLGKSEILLLPVRCVFIATGNNPSLSNEMVRRTIPIHLDARVAKPWLREGFKHPDLRGYVAARRGEIVAAGLTICLAWIQAGRPPGSKTIGMYEEWSRVMGGVLEVAGIPGFLGNLSAFYEDADDETAVWEALFDRWRQTCGDRPVGAGELYKLVVDAIGDDPIPLDLVVPVKQTVTYRVFVERG